MLKLSRDLSESKAIREHERGEPDLQQSKDRRTVSSDIHTIWASLTNYKQCIKHVSNVSDNENKRTTSGRKKGMETCSYLPRQGK